MTKEKAILVTTEHKGVFFGYGDPVLNESRTVRIERARMCVYWESEVHGVLGLAASGPTKNCRITPEVPALTLQAVTAIAEVSTEAEKEWQKGHWS